MERKKDKKIINTTTTGMAQTNLNQVYGEAASQIIQGYKGIRVDKFGDEIAHHGRNLKDISNYKVNPKYSETNLKQQAGFSAELVEEARKNKEAILAGDKTRVRTTDGIGKTNDTQYDHIKLDKNGNIIEGSGTQMKFLKVKVDPKTGEKSYNVIDNLANQDDWKRYDTKVVVPKEDYEGAIEYAQKQYDKNMEHYKKALDRGNVEAAKKYKKRAEDYKNTQKRIKPAKLTQEEALAARKNPEKFVAKEVAKDIHSGGIAAAKSGIIVGGSIALAQNLFAVIKENKDLDEAAADILMTTAKTGAVAYTVGAGGTALKTLMHSSKNQLIRRMGTTNLPTLMVTGAIEIGSSLKRYVDGDIDEFQLLDELGEKGVGMITAGYCATSGAVIGATIGSVVPVVGTAIGGVVGGFVGSVLGYNISGVIYKEAMGTLKREKISYERRVIIEGLANEAIKENEKYKQMFIEYSRTQLNNREVEIRKNLEMLDRSIFENNIDDFFNSVNNIGKIFGGSLQFQTMKEFDDFMLDDTSVLEL